MQGGYQKAEVGLPQGNVLHLFNAETCVPLVEKEGKC